MRRKKLILLAPVAIAGVLLFIALGGLVVRELWNALLPEIFNLRTISFWQAVGLLALCRILFGGFGHRGFSRSRRRLAEGWEFMTPEERDRLRDRMRSRCGLGPIPGAGLGQAPGQPPAS